MLGMCSIATSVSVINAPPFSIAEVIEWYLSEGRPLPSVVLGTKGNLADMFDELMGQWFFVCLFLSVCLSSAVIYWCVKGSRPAFTQNFSGHSGEESHLLGSWIRWTLLTGVSLRQRISQAQAEATY